MKTFPALLEVIINRSELLCFIVYNNNNNNMWIYKAHSVSKQAESEAPININVLIIWTN